MTEGPSRSFLYEHCDVPDGETLTAWRERQAPTSPRRAQVAGGFLAALVTLAPIVFSVRGSRRR
jgi:hypothetical protein